MIYKEINLEGGKTRTVSEPAYQYDVGLRLRITGASIPTGTPFHFSNQKGGGTAYSVDCVTANSITTVTVPDACFVNGNRIIDFVVYCYAVVTSSSQAVVTYEIDIPVYSRTGQASEYSKDPYLTAFDEIADQVATDAQIASQSASTVSALTAQVASNTSNINQIKYNGKTDIQWVSGGYKTDGGWTNYDSIDGNVDGIHPIPIQFKAGDVIPCPSGYTMAIKIYKYWYNTSSFTSDSEITRSSNPYTVPQNKDGMFFMPVYKTVDKDVMVRGATNEFTDKALKTINDITPLITSATSYRSVSERISNLENSIESLKTLMLGVTGGLCEKFDSDNFVEMRKDTVSPNTMTESGVLFIPSAYASAFQDVPDNTGNGIIICLKNRQYYGSVQFYIMVSGGNAGNIYYRTTNKSALWDGVSWITLHSKG